MGSDQLEALENEPDEEEEEEEEDAKDEEENEEKTDEERNEEGKDEEGNDESNDHRSKPRTGSRKKYPADILKLAASVRKTHEDLKRRQRTTLNAMSASETSSMVFRERQSAASFLLPEIFF